VGDDSRADHFQLRNAAEPVVGADVLACKFWAAITRGLRPASRGLKEIRRLEGYVTVSISET